MSHTRLHTLLALLGRAPPRAAGDDNDEEEENKGAGGRTGSRARTCVIVATTALEDMTLARLGLLPKCVRCIAYVCVGIVYVWGGLGGANVDEPTLLFLGSPSAFRCPSSRRPSTWPA